MSDFKVGDEVQWTHAVAKGRSVSMNLREGRIVEFSENGLSAKVKLRSGRHSWLRVDQLQSRGAKSHIASFVEAMCKANRRG